MPSEISNLFSSQNAAFTGLFWILLVGLIVCVVFPERVHKPSALKKGFIAFLTVIGTKAFVSFALGVLAMIFSQDLGRDSELAEFLVFSSGVASIAAAISWVAILYGFWQLYRATAMSAESRVAARRKVAQALRITKQVDGAQPATEG